MDPIAQQAPVLDLGVETPPARLEVDVFDLAGHGFRLLGSKRVQQLAPDKVALGLARGVGRLQWYWPPTRRRAIGRVALTLAGTHREHEAAALAHEELIIQAMRFALKMRPWMALQTQLHGGERLEAAVASGRPVILAGVHIGWGVSNILAVHGYTNLVTVATEWLVPRDGRLPRGYAGFTARSFRRNAAVTGLRFLPAGGAYSTVRAALQRRVLCFLMMDMPGAFPVQMAGKRAYLRSGIARLARDTDALVVPTVALLERRGPSLHVLEPIDPRAAKDVEEVLARLASAVGEVIVEHPASVEPLGLTRDIWRDDAAAYPVELWRRRRLRDRVTVLRPRRRLRRLRSAVAARIRA